MEDIVDVTISWKINPICHRVNLLQDSIGTQMLEVKFIRGVSSLDISSKEPDMVTNFILRGLEDMLVREVGMIFLSCKDTLCELVLDILQMGDCIISTRILA